MVARAIDWIAERESEGEEFFSDEFADILALADGYSASSKKECWFYFDDLADAHKAVAALRERGERNLELFKSPEDSGQHNWTLTLTLGAPVLGTDKSRKMESILRGHGYDPVEVGDLRGASFSLVLDRPEDFVRIESDWVLRLGGFAVVRNPIYRNRDETVTRSYRLDLVERTEEETRTCKRLGDAIAKHL